MESNKNNIDALKVLLVNTLDSINEDNTFTLRQIKELQEDVSLMNERLDSYSEKIKHLEEKLSKANQTIAELANNVVSQQTNDALIQTPKSVELQEENTNQEEEETIFILDDDEVIETPEQEIIVSNPDIKESEVITEIVSEPVILESVTTSQGDLFSQTLKEEPKIIHDTAKPEWFDWEVDYPAPYIEDIVTGIGFNDRLLFLRELFRSDEELFRETVTQINEMETFTEAVEYVREKFPEWNEQKDEVYRFYMNVRRKLRK